MKKRLFSILLVTVMLLSVVFAVVACDSSDAKAALERLIITQNKKVVSEAFTLVRYLGENNEFEVTWTSSNENALKLTQQETNYLATPIIGDNRETVTLTAKIGSSKKEFTVYVKGTDAYLFQSNYEFPQLNKKVSADFDLVSSFKVGDKTCTISWTIVEGSSVAKIEGNKCVITVDTTQNVNVRIKATFKYNDSTAEAEYPFIVGDVLAHDAEVAAWYAGIQTSIDVTGWVISVADYFPSRASSDTYKNVTVYLYDEDFCHSFYAYGIDFPFEDLDKLVPGAHVTATIPYKEYNGLVEGTGGTMSVDDTTPINIDEHIYNFDVDAATNGLRYGKASEGMGGSIVHTGSLVKLSGWKVTSVGTKPNEGVDATILTLTKNSQKVTVAVSKRMKGCYTATSGDATWEALCGLINTVKVNDIVDVTGCLTYYNGWQILPRDVDDVKTATTESTVSDGTSVVKAIGDVEKALEGVSGAIVATAKTVTLPATSNGVAISYALSATRNTIKLENSTNLVITPAAAEKVYLQATFTIGSYKTSTFYEIQAQSLDDAGKVANVKSSLDDNIPSKVEKIEEINLPLASEEFEDVNIAWTADQTWATIDQTGKLTITPPTADATLKLTATITCGATARDTREITISVVGKPTEVLARFTFGFNGAAKHADGSSVSEYTEKDGSHTLTLSDMTTVYTGAFDKQGNSGLKLGTSSKSGTFKFTVPDAVKSVKIYVAKYKTYDTYIKVNDGAQQALTKNSDDGEYDVITIDTSTNKTVTFATFDVPVQSGSNTNHSVRCMINTIEFLSTNAAA